MSEHDVDLGDLDSLMSNAPLPAIEHLPAVQETPAHPLIKPHDPALLGFPPMLPIELAMRVAPVKDICEAYGLSKEEFIEITKDAVFAKAYENACDELKKDGMSFRIKAKLQAEELLKKSWSMIHSDHTPSNIKADLIKSTIRWAGYEPKGDNNAGGVGNAFQININLG
jgi:hypothetical protein